MALNLKSWPTPSKGEVAPYLGALDARGRGVERSGSNRATATHPRPVSGLVIAPLVVAGCQQKRDAVLHARGAKDAEADKLLAL